MWGEPSLRVLSFSFRSLAKDPEDLAHVLSLLLEVFELPEGHLELACGDFGGILCLIPGEASVVEDISNDVEEEGHVLLSGIFRVVVLGIRVQVVLRVLIEGCKQETQPEQVLFTEVQVLVAQALVDEGAYTQRRYL